MKKGLILILVFFSISELKAQETTELSKIKFSGYLDVYYTYDFHQPEDPNQRQYVTQLANHNEFNINLAVLRAQYQSENIRSTIALQSGTYPLYNYAEPTVLGQILNEAKVGVRVGKSSWIDVGILPGHFGYESAFSFNNELYSQALATEYTPYYQTGVQYTNDINEKITIRGVIINGWQNIYETNDAKAFGTAIDFAFSENLTLSYGNFFGNEPFGNEDEFRMHHNFYIAYTENKLDLIGIADLTFQNPDDLLSTPVHFYTFIGEYNFTDDFSLAGRFENVRDERGVLLASNDYQTNILTFSGNYRIYEYIKVRAEFRSFFGNEAIWFGSNGDKSPESNQVVSIGLSINL